MTGAAPDFDLTMRPVLVGIALVVFPVALYFRVRSQMTREPLDRRQEGWFILLTLRPAGLAPLGGLIAYLISPASMAWGAMRLPEWLRWAGAAGAAISAVLFFWTLRNLGRNLTDTVVTRRAHTLVTSGPYRWVRHPFYDSVAILIFGSAIAAANWFMFTGGVVFMGLIALRTRREESNLLARFGEPYRAYLARTGRFLPRFGGRAGGG